VNSEFLVFLKVSFAFIFKGDLGDDFLNTGTFNSETLEEGRLEYEELLHVGCSITKFCKPTHIKVLNNVLSDLYVYTGIVLALVFICVQCVSVLSSKNFIVTEMFFLSLQVSTHCIRISAERIQHF
jgi:hypothetical protein